MMNEFDIIVIGSGLGGLETAVMLSKEGFNVCVVEKNRQVGGCLQSYVRHGYKLDTGMHYIGSLGSGQVLHQCFSYFGIMDRLRLKKLDEEAFDRIHYAGGVYDYAMGEEAFIETLSRQFPAESGNLRRYVARLSEVGHSISVDNFKKGYVSNSGALSYFGMSASGVIDSLIADERLRNVLAANSVLYGGVYDKSTFYEHAMISYSYMEGAYRCIDGSMHIATSLVDEIRKNGGTVRCDSEVERIMVDGDRVTGVQLKGGERIGAKHVISNMHPQLTLDLLDKNKVIKKAFHTRIRSLENSYGLFTMYLLMKPGVCLYVNRNEYIHERESVWYVRHDRPIDCCLISMQPMSDDERFANVISVITPMYIDELSEWSDTLPERRGEAYKAFKERKIAELLALMKRHGFDWSDKVEYIYSNSPLSYRDYTGTIDGSAYGILKDYHSPMTCLLSPRTKLQNLYFTGQNINVHGALGVTLTSVITCAEFLGMDYLAKKIGNY